MRSAAGSAPTASSAPSGAAQAAAASHIAAIERMCTPICLTWGCLGGSHASTLGAKPLARMFSILTLYDFSRAPALPAGTSWYLNMLPVTHCTARDRACRWQAGALPTKSAGALKWSSSKAILARETRRRALRKAHHESALQLVSPFALFRRSCTKEV
eukprot:scaffold6639_cov63-Phaeocystis_antarctica.AAC.6